MWMLNPKTDPLAYFHVISHPLHPGTPHFLTPAKVSFLFNRSEQYRLVSKHTKNDFSTIYHVYTMCTSCMNVGVIVLYGLGAVGMITLPGNFTR